MLREILFLLSLVKINEAQLNKRPLYGGLGHLDLNFLRSPTHFASGGGDRNACHCNGAGPQDVLTVTYQGSGTQSMTLCMCPNAVTGASYMIDMMGKVPYPVRRFNRGMISSTAGSCGGAASGGDVSFYCESNMHISVYIHESAHSLDRGRSGSKDWHDAVARDSCVPDNYAMSSYAEDFAQVVVVWIHLVGTGRHQDFGGNQYSCMRNQLQQMSIYLPAQTIQP